MLLNANAKPLSKKHYNQDCCCYEDHKYSKLDPYLILWADGICGILEPSLHLDPNALRSVIARPPPLGAGVRQQLQQRSIYNDLRRTPSATAAHVEARPQLGPLRLQHEPA